jgi:hypothetical protein
LPKTKSITNFDGDIDIVLQPEEYNKLNFHIKGFLNTASIKSKEIDKFKKWFVKQTLITTKLLDVKEKTINNQLVFETEEKDALSNKKQTCFYFIFDTYIFKLFTDYNWCKNNLSFNYFLNNFKKLENKQLKNIDTNNWNTYKNTFLYESVYNDINFKFPKEWEAITNPQLGISFKISDGNFNEGILRLKIIKNDTLDKQTYEYKLGGYNYEKINQGFIFDIRKTANDLLYSNGIIINDDIYTLDWFYSDYVKSANNQSIGNIKKIFSEDKIKTILKTFSLRDKKSYPWLGVRHIIINDEMQKEKLLPYNYGAYVAPGFSYEQLSSQAVITNSPADEAGIVAGDIILEIDNKKIDEVNPLTEVILSHKIGDKILIKIYHDKQEIKKEIILGEIIY